MTWLKLWGFRAIPLTNKRQAAPSGGVETLVIRFSLRGYFIFEDCKHDQGRSVAAGA